MYAAREEMVQKWRSIHGEVFGNYARLDSNQPGIRNLRRDDFVSPSENMKCVVSRCQSTTSGTTSGFNAVVSLAAQWSEKGIDVRIPHVQIGRGKTPGKHEPSAGISGLRFCPRKTVVSENHFLKSTPFSAQAG
jgi:hypothetical protein